MKASLLSDLVVSLYGKTVRIPEDTVVFVDTIRGVARCHLVSIPFQIFPNEFSLVI